jgi:hypothetical protein
MYNVGKDQSKDSSFRGYEIPEVVKEKKFIVSDGDRVIKKILDMTKNDREAVTIDSVHFENGRVSEVKLTIGDIVTIETAIALAENNLLYGYSTGATMNKGKTLRSKPTYKPDGKGKGLYELPRF